MAEHVMYARETAAVTFQDTGDTVTYNSHPFDNGDAVTFASITSTTGITTNVIYYVVNDDGSNTFKLAATPGGSALPLTTNGSGIIRQAGKYTAPRAEGYPTGTAGAIPVESFNVGANIEFMENTDTGPGGRGRPAGAPGALGVAGTLNTKLYPQTLGRLLRSVFGTRAVTASTSGTTYAITSSTAASPTVVTIATHTLKVGDAVLISGSTGATPSLNGIHYITAVPSNTQITLDMSCSVGAGAAGTVALTTNRNKLLPEDNTLFDTFSFQKYYDSTHAEYVTGCKITRFGISVRSKEFARCTFEFVGKDSAKNGGTWSNGSAAPSITAYTHAPTGATGAYFYPPVIMDPLKFYQARISLGGTLAVTNGEIVVTNATARTEIDNLNIGVDLGVSADAFGLLLDDRTVQAVDEGARAVTVSFEPNFKVAWFEFYDLWKANPQAPLIAEIYFRGPLVHGTSYTEYKVVFPNLRISSAPTVEQNAAYGLKRQTVTAQAAVDPVTGYDMGLVIQSPEDYTA